ncbi:hypothetical protein P9D47_07610 [Bacillus haynesii]|uniref:hypothetical protein n=1 Tax=Bacillus haynesii TaxID=1925021 RepID=UPI001592F258|nr:hypothetical protein [Bacillus haynesii]MCY7776847.1 hypothetical protein [Bacillus haynesii]MEC0671296.1 hypothetical protein [Bacillus haynesii]MEC1467907.1 hypothetical protein [Bacillus haynesii]NVB34201.1 hypothetical protein [Bacillus licheniformis]
MTVNTINRDAGDKSKGFRLQRLRAIQLLLEQMEHRDENVSVFASTEYLDDVYIKTVTHEGSTTHLEGDKNYDISKKFSFMSEEVTNSLIIFLDNWLNCDMSESLFYCFYTNVNYTKEKNSQTTKSLDIKLPELPVLKLLIEKRIDDKVVDCIKKRLLHEYQKQYKGENKGYFEVIKGFDNRKWRDFLSRINWQFGQYNDKELERSLVKRIEERSFYTNIDVSGKEKFIIDLLAEKFSSNEVLKDPIAKVVSSVHVENILLQISKDIVKQSDPVYDIWGSLEPPSDERGLKEKILDVCTTYKEFKIGVKARHIAAVKKEHDQLSDRDKGSFRYRVFEACQRKLPDLLEKDGEVNIDCWLEELFLVSKSHLEDKSKDYSYPITNDDAIKGTILELIDSCFLSFDEKGFYYGDI